MRRLDVSLSRVPLTLPPPVVDAAGRFEVPPEYPKPDCALSLFPVTQGAGRASTDMQNACQKRRAWRLSAKNQTLVVRSRKPRRCES